MTESDSQLARPTTLADGLCRLTAPNPSPMTGPGTNSYIVGRGPYVIIDPGVDDASHLDALMEACEDRIEAICLTHRHPDHVGGAALLAERTGAPVLAWPKPELAHYDRPIHIDRELADDESLMIGDLQLVVRYTPGHAADHIAFELPESGFLLAGDALMNDATVVILPPDGDMGAYLATLERLAALDPRCIAPAHGRTLDNPQREISAVIAHRRERETQVLEALSTAEPRTAEMIADRLYPQLHDHLKSMAALQVQAHLLHLAEQGRALADDHDWLRSGD